MFWEIQNRIITDSDRNKECPVTLEFINENEKYCQCSQCKYNIHIDLFNMSSIRKCPMCRLLWENKIVYVNSTTDEINLEKVFEMPDHNQDDLQPMNNIIRQLPSLEEVNNQNITGFLLLLNQRHPELTGTPPIAFIERIRRNWI